MSVSPGGDRSRLRGWLLGSLAGLCELQLLRERQEMRVRKALRACETTEEEEDEDEDEEAAAEQMDSLPELMWELEQQVQSLRLEDSGACGDMAETNSWPSSGFHAPTSPGVPPDSPASFCGNGFPSFHCVPESYPQVDHSEARMHYANERPKSLGDLGIRGASPCQGGRGMVHRSFSAPYSSSQDYISDLHAKYQSAYQSQKMDPFVFPSPLHAVSLQNPNICQSQFQSCYYDDDAPYSDYSGKSAAGIDIYETSPDGHQAFPETTQWQKVESYMLSLIHRHGLIARASNPRTTLNAEPGKVVTRQNSLCKRPSQLDRKSHPSPAASPCGYDSDAVTNRAWPPWNCGAEGPGSQAVSLCQPHSSLRKPPKLHVALAHPRSLSMDHYEHNYSPVSISNYPNDLTFDASPNKLSSDSPTLVFPSRAPRNEACDTDFPLPSCEDEDDFKKHPAPAVESGCQMVNAQYIPAQVAIRPQLSHRPAKKSPPISKVQSVELSLDRCPAAISRSTAFKKCWFPEEALDICKYGARKMSPHTQKTPRSQSENSLVNNPASIDRTITKYHTVDREEVALNKGSHQCCPPVSAHRKWRSTAEICQDELSSSDLYRGPKRSKKFTKVAAAVSASTDIGFHMLYGYTRSESEYTSEQLLVNQPPVCEPEEDMRAYTGNCFGESELSLSEPDSLGSRDTDDSESDETGGLVWPQQLSPRVISSTGAGNSGDQPKVFVKIKASHALKKKILRFRTGSLKVMTTV